MRFKLLRMPAWAGMDVAEIVRAVDDPEFLVAGREIENLLVVGKNDERREAQLRADGNDVFLGVLHDAQPLRLRLARATPGRRLRRQALSAMTRTDESVPLISESLVSWTCSF